MHVTFLNERRYDVMEMREKYSVFVAAGLIILETVGGAWFIINVLWVIAVGKWINLPLFLLDFFGMIPVLYLSARINKERTRDS